MTSPEKSLFRHMNRPNIIKRRCILGYQHSSPVFLPIVALLPELSEPIYPRISVLPIQWQLLFELLSILQCDVLSRESQCKSKQVSLSFAGCSLFLYHSKDNAKRVYARPLNTTYCGQLIIPLWLLNHTLVLQSLWAIAGFCPSLRS